MSRSSPETASTSARAVRETQLVTETTSRFDAPRWSAEPGPWGWPDLLAMLVWTAAIVLVFREVISFQGALFYFDVTEINLPYRDFVAGEFREGRFSRWLPGLYCGMPLFSESQAGYLHPSKLLYLFLPTWKAFNLDTVLSVWLAGIAAFGWLRRHLGTSGALTGAAIVGVGGFTWAHLIHTSMINALVGVPFSLWMLEWSWHGGRRRAVALGSLAMASQVFAGHLQDALMTMLLVGLHGLYRAGLERGRAARFNALAPAVAMVLLAVAVSAVQWIPSKELIDRSPRAGGLSYQDAVFGSWHPELIPTLIVRETYGTRARDTDWMDGFYPYQEMNTFLGILGLGLAALGAGAYRHRWVAFWLILAGVSVILMLGKHTLIFDVFYRVPILGSGRIPVRYHLWLTMAVAALAGVGVDRLARPGQVRLRSAFLLIGTLVLISVPFLIYKHIPVWTEAQRWTWTYHQNRLRWLGEELVAATFREGFLAVLAAVLAWQLGRNQLPERRRKGLAGLLPVLVIAELLTAHAHEVPTVDPSYWTDPPLTVARLRDDPRTIRIYGFGDSSVAEPGYASEPVDFFPARDTLSRSLAPVWGLKSSGGHTPIIPLRLRDYDDAANTAGVRFHLESVTHLLIGRRGAGDRGPEAMPAGSALILPNFRALPRARLVGRPVYTRDRESSVAALLEIGTEALERVIVEDPDRFLDPEAPVSGRAEIVVDLPERVVVEVEAETPAYLFLADTFDPGWQATLDGRPVPIHPAHINFRAVAIPEGPHEVVFTYRPAGFLAGMIVSLMGMACVCVAIVAPGSSRGPGPLEGDTGWPRRWPLAFGLVLLGIVLASSVQLHPETGRPELADRWRGTVHRFTWGAGIEAMRP